MTVWASVTNSPTPQLSLDELIRSNVVTRWIEVVAEDLVERHLGSGPIVQHFNRTTKTSDHRQTEADQRSHRDVIKTRHLIRRRLGLSGVDVEHRTVHWSARDVPVRHGPRRRYDIRGGDRARSATGVGRRHAVTHARRASRWSRVRLGDPFRRARRDTAGSPGCPIRCIWRRPLDRTIAALGTRRCGSDRQCDARPSGGDGHARRRGVAGRMADAAASFASHVRAWLAGSHGVGSGRTTPILRRVLRPAHRGAGAVLARRSDAT
jgi:hypothetical protein